MILTVQGLVRNRSHLNLTLDFTLKTNPPITKRENTKGCNLAKMTKLLMTRFTEKTNTIVNVAAILNNIAGCVFCRNNIRLATLWETSPNNPPRTKPIAGQIINNRTVNLQCNGYEA